MTGQSESPGQGKVRTAGSNPELSPCRVTGNLRSRLRSRMEYVVKFPPRPRTQALICGAFLRAVLLLVLLDETFLPANMRALLKA